MAQMQSLLRSPSPSLIGSPVTISPADNQNPQPMASLYVGDLEQNVTDAQLFDMFSQIGHVVSVRVCRDVTTRRSLGYAYVNFSNSRNAARALDLLNFTPLNNKPIRIMYSNRDPTIRRSGAANIFIKNLDRAIDNKALLDTFSSFGNILSCKIATDSSGQSKGYGFVQFEQEEAAQNAIEKLNGMCLNDKPIYVGPFLRKPERDATVNVVKFNNVFVKNLSESTTEDHLLDIFGEYGKITSLVVMREGDGKSKCFGFVNFESPEDASRAVLALDGKKFGEKEWYVGKAQKKSEREMELKGKYEQNSKEIVCNYQGLNLFLKNLDDSMEDEKLKELFAEFGNVTSCKVMRDPHGASKGSGFVAFSNVEEASRAILEMNGKLIGSKPLYAALAQRKEERKAQLQAQYSQMRPAPSPPRMPIYPGMGQQLFYGQAPALAPPHAGFAFPQRQLSPGINPGGNFFMPMAPHQMSHPTPPGRRSAPISPPQMHARGGYHYLSPNSSPLPGFAGGMQSPYNAPAATAMSALANASPGRQRAILGESLYPLVDQIEHQNAAKITGMLLEMDKTEVLHLLESPEALSSKVAEAIEVLQNVAGRQEPRPAINDQLARLSLHDVVVS